MERSPGSVVAWLFSSEAGPSGRLLPRWLFLRALGLIFFSAFYSLVFQIKGLIGPDGILPASEYLAVLHKLGPARFWYAPTLLWFGTGSQMLIALCCAGLIASILLVLNIWPRAMLVLCVVCFLSFVSAAQDFSSYQSDGMLLEAGFISLFFAPPGLRPGLGRLHPPSRASLFLLQWEWFRIYFESGVVKLASGDLQWRNFTAMDEYYQNGPLPTWIGWYVQHLPHGVHAFATGATLILELGLVWMLFLPRRYRIICFFIATLWQIPVILTANYTFLNYLVLLLGVLLLDDGALTRWLPNRLLRLIGVHETSEPAGEAGELQPQRKPRMGHFSAFRLAFTSVVLAWIFYATTVQMLWIIFPRLPLPTSPVAALEPFRIANRYGLFAVMTRGRWEIEFQGSKDGQTWTPYPFRYKPQNPGRAPGIYAPYQPRFDWNLWFASLGTWRDNMFVVSTEERMLSNSQDVLALFADNPFRDSPPKFVRAVIWQYWFTSLAEKRASGLWWNRKLLGLYAPEITKMGSDQLGVVEWPAQLPPRQ